jgi:hypothetical protein
MLEIKLTREQAEWLRKHLLGLADDFSWHPERAVGDEAEHTKTIAEKCRAALQEKSWDPIR